jgi:oxalate decarboxylase/phosphoglucose isomerase-like protein (cupin superfamily)
MSISSEFHLIELPKILDARGNLSFIESKKHLPFAIKRVYWVYDVPGGEVRTGHAYLKNKEFIIALSGSFDVVIDDKQNQHKFSLNRSYYGLYVPSGYWRHMENFSTNALALVVASHAYDKTDYIRDYQKYLTAN